MPGSRSVEGNGCPAQTWLNGNYSGHRTIIFCGVVMGGMLLVTAV